MGVCFDTCHAYSAGYDLVEDYEGVWSAFSQELGLERLGLFHMNDSKKGPGSRMDRHEHIGRGCIGKDPFGFFLNDRRLARVPKILETPKASPLDDRRNLKRLRSLIKGRKKGRRA